MKTSYYVVDILDPTDPGSSHETYEEACEVQKSLIEKYPECDYRIFGGHLGWDFAD